MSLPPTIPALLASLTFLGAPRPEPTSVLVPSAPTADTVEIARRPQRLVVGQRVRMAARVLGPDGSEVAGAPVSWRTNSSSYVSVGADGRITGVRPGQVEIMAISGDQRTAFTLEVVPDDVTAVTLAPDYATARVGEPVSLHLTVHNGSGEPIEGLLAEWEVTPATATIDDAGQFVPETFGLYTVVARVGDRKAIATVRVAVNR